MTVTVTLPHTSYDIIIERGALKKVASHLPLDRRVLIVTDDGVPSHYAASVEASSRYPTVVTLPQGEDTKSLENFGYLLTVMLEHGFTRGDCVVAVGGGVIGDLSGFVAASYMRGIDFYNIPTTLLSEVDSSIGGKTAINLGGIKNPVGAFYQPKRVLIDPDVLKTLPSRQISSGLAECIKMALTSDRELFEFLEDCPDPLNALDEIIYRSLLIKKAVVEEDEKESGLRKVLNFGHTLGHAIESEYHTHSLFHGECVALGMLPMVSDTIRQRLLALYRKLSLPTSVSFDRNAAAIALKHDKKSGKDSVTAVLVDTVGQFRFEKLSTDTLIRKLDYFTQ